MYIFYDNYFERFSIKKCKANAKIRGLVLFAYIYQSTQPLISVSHVKLKFLRNYFMFRNGFDPIRIIGQKTRKLR